MQGVRLLVAGFVLCVALVAPGALFASDDPAPPQGEPGTVTVAPVEAGDPLPEPAPPDAHPEPAPTDPVEVPTSEDGRAKDGRNSAKRDPGARSSATRTVAMRDIKFKPKKITIDPGDTVQWRNEDSVKHDAIGENVSFETPIISEGETSSHTFKKERKYPYFCSIHEGMVGTIVVGSSSGGGDDGGGSSGGGSGGTSGSSATGSTGSTGSTSSFGSTGTGSTSSLASTGHEALWLSLIGAALLWLGAATGVVVVAQRREHARRGR